MRKLFIELDQIIDKVDFDNIWNGFTRYDFALYDEECVYLKNAIIPRDNRFLGNTAIEYDDAYIAIWHIENPSSEDTEVLAANLVHEMFHAYQKEKGESRFPSDLKMLDYPYSEENIAIKYSENLLLVRAFLAQDIYEKESFLSRFMSARKYRERLFGEIIKQEYFSETVEGMAEYVGSMALKQISPSKYASRIEGYKENLQAFDESFFDIRRKLYYTGAVYCITLSDADIDFFHSVGSTERSLFDITSDNISAERPGMEIDGHILSASINQYLGNKKQILDEYLSSHNDEVLIDSFICGYDPMNMIKMENEILCNNFVMLMKKGEDEPIFIQGPVLVRLKKGSINEVISYVK